VPIIELKGIWGGLAEVERKRVRNKAAAAAPAPSVEKPQPAPAGPGHSRRGRRGGLYRVLEELTASPGRSARVAWYPGPHTAASMATRLANGWISVDAVTAVVRGTGILVAMWLLATTAPYLLARLTGLPGLVLGISWATLPAVRKIADAAVAAAVLGGAVLASSPASAQASPPAPIIVDVNVTKTTLPALDVPVPAGRRDDQNDLHH
jgi:hypothetical protein